MRSSNRCIAIPPITAEVSSPPSPDSATVTCAAPAGTRGTSAAPSCRHTVRRRSGQLVHQVEVVGLDTSCTWWRSHNGPPRAVRRRDSSKAGSSNEMEQVLTGSADSPAIVATTALESTPPDRNAPSGTSEIMRKRTDSRRRRRSLLAGLLLGDWADGLKRHVPVFSWCAARARPRRRVSVCPGVSLLDLAEDRTRLGHVAEAKYSSTANGSMSAARTPAWQHDRLQFRREQQGAIRHEGVVQRLHARAGRGPGTASRDCDPRGEGEHAAEPVARIARPRLSHACTITSVSLRVWKTWPSACSSGTRSW